MAETYTGKAGQKYFNDHSTELLSDEIGKWNAAKLNPYLSSTDSIVDFGCSTGQVTVNLKARDKTGIEVNEPAAAYAREKNLLKVVGSTADLESGKYDAVTTHHVLEHVLEPFAVLKEFHRLLKPQGTAIIVVPGEAAAGFRHNHWYDDDIKKHVYAWTPLTLGNLCVAAGFAVVVAKVCTYQRPSRFLGPLNAVPGSGKALGQLRQSISGENEVIVVARKP